jgi:hypothetical protein
MIVQCAGKSTPKILHRAGSGWSLKEAAKRVKLALRVENDRIFPTRGVLTQFAIVSYNYFEWN